jgi:hypothetical protein
VPVPEQISGILTAFQKPKFIEQPLMMQLDEIAKIAPDFDQLDIESQQYVYNTLKTKAAENMAAMKPLLTESQSLYAKEFMPTSPSEILAILFTLIVLCYWAYRIIKRLKELFCTLVEVLHLREGVQVIKAKLWKYKRALLAAVLSAGSLFYLTEINTGLKDNLIAVHFPLFITSILLLAILFVLGLVLFVLFVKEEHGMVGDKVAFMRDMEALFVTLKAHTGLTVGLGLTRLWADTHWENAVLAGLCFCGFLALMTGLPLIKQFENQIIRKILVEGRL